VLPIEGLRGWCSHIFVAILVFSEMNSAERPTTNLLFHPILVDAMLGATIVFAVAVL
jgi:hypothetical protein